MSICNLSTFYPTCTLTSPSAPANRPPLVARFQISRADLNRDRALSLSEWSSFSQPLLEVPNQNVVRKCLGDMLEKLRARKQHEANAKAVYVPDEAAAGDAESEESSDWGEEGDT